jgi:hypothetical protein
VICDRVVKQPNFKDVVNKPFEEGKAVGKLGADAAFGQEEEYCGKGDCAGGSHRCPNQLDPEGVLELEDVAPHYQC